MDDLVTIAIPTYNRANLYLRDVISAALDQTWENIEVLVGDNASTDNTDKVVSEFKDPRLRYIQHKNNIGANGNFNALLNAAKGKWFFLFHDDDMIDGDFIESCMEIAKPDKNFGFIRTGVRAIDLNGKGLKERPNKITGEMREDFYLSWFNSQTGLYLCNTLFNTHHLKEVGGFQSLHNLLQDNYALVRLLDKWSHGVIEDIKASYRYSYDQQTYKVPVKAWCEDFRGLLDLIVAQCDSNRRNEILNRGQRFFGHLCMRRAHAISSPINRFLAKILVARYFGPRLLINKNKILRS